MKWFILILLWAAVFSLDHWVRWVALALALLATYFTVGLWWYRNSTCLRRVYFAVIHRFSSLGGFYLAAADEAGQPYDPEIAFPILLRERYPTWDESRIQDFIDTNWARFQEGTYHEEWVNLLAARNPSDPRDKFERMVREQFAKSENSYRVRSLIAAGGPSSRPRNTSRTYLTRQL